MFVIGIFAFFIFIVSLLVYASVLIVQYLIVRYKIHKDKRAINFRAKYATLSTFFIQFISMKVFDLFPWNRLTFFLVVFINTLLGFLWLFFVATNADEMWRMTKQKGYLLWTLTAASVLSVWIVVLNTNWF